MRLSGRQISQFRQLAQRGNACTDCCIRNSHLLHSSLKLDALAVILTVRVEHWNRQAIRVCKHALQIGGWYEPGCLAEKLLLQVWALLNRFNEAVQMVDILLIRGNERHDFTASYCGVICK